MASCSSSSSLLTEEQFRCSICLDVFVNPVSTNCGHNFCKACITQYWNVNDVCQCPMCKKTFSTRPELFVNTFISEMAASVRKSMAGKVAKRRQEQTEVACDICTGKRLRALKSCLVCQTSYCEAHLEPHNRVPRLIKHKLIDPVENLEDRMCKKHDRPLELFCRTDQMCVCQFCTDGDHRNHNTVPLEEECMNKTAQLEKSEGEMQQMIQERLQKVKEIKLSVKTSKRDTERETADSIEFCAALVRSIERSQTELLQVIEEKQMAMEKRAEGFIQELEQEIAELKRRSTELEQLVHTEDHLHLLQTFQSLSSTPPDTKDWSQISVENGVGTLMTVVSRLDDTFINETKKLCGDELKRIQQYAVDVTLDPDTAYPSLILSDDLKQVRDARAEKNLPDNPERFDSCACILGKQSFSSGRVYWEVQVVGKEWDLGVATESINRKGEIALTPEAGYWTIWLNNGTEYKALAGPAVPLSLREKPQKVGVFVDYEEGRVSFYNVEARSHIYSYTDCSFTEKLYPYFGPNDDGEGANSAPLIITPVNLR